ncbi:FliM/FliN family flagellar motor switch protein [Aeoliella sp. SH292]|uniref:FliM/FliN family flagellar motor switch protein n=1 Tax=Aeoliella sp. SH292 TaxID=3454464 RepID=UPI003F9A3284
MSQLTPELVAEILRVCEQNAADIADALARGIDAEVTVTVGKPTTYDAAALPEGFDGPGLAVMMQFGDVALAIGLPEPSGLTRNWMREPDITGIGMLNTLAQELSMLVVPDSMMAGKFGAAWVTDLSQAMKAGEVADGASLVPLVLTDGSKASHLTMVWPCNAPGKLLPPPKPKAPEIKVEQVKQQAAAPPPPPPKPKPKSMQELPPYARHLLKISVPVAVQLVSKKLSVQEVLELAPGAMISFEKSCDDSLELIVGNQIVARGAAVKVGERFGLEIEEMTMPEEHFWPVRKSG